MEHTELPAAPRSRRPRAAFRPDPHELVRDLVFVMVCLEVLVVLLDLWLHCGGVIASYDLRTLFDSTSERGLGSWLAVTQTTLIALTLWGMAATYRQMGSARARQVGWTVLAVFFTYLAFDDGSQFHERIGTAFDEAAAAETGLGAAFPSYYWQLLFGPFFAAMGLFMVLFLWKELRAARLRLLTGAALALLALAVALDFVDGLDASHPLNVYAQLAESWNLEPRTQALFGMAALDAVIHFSRSLEESIEMMAMTLLWAVFLSHFAGTVGEVRLRWMRGAAGQETSRTARASFPHADTLGLSRLRRRRARRPHDTVRATAQGDDPPRAPRARASAADGVPPP